MAVLFVLKIICLMSKSFCYAYLVSVDKSYYFVKSDCIDAFISLVVNSGFVSPVVFHARVLFLVSRFKGNSYVEV